jgi:hypothetical protein
LVEKLTDQWKGAMHMGLTLLGNGEFEATIEQFGEKYQARYQTFFHLPDRTVSSSNIQVFDSEREAEDWLLKEAKELGFPGQVKIEHKIAG